MLPSALIYDVGARVVCFRSSIAHPAYTPVYASLCTSRYPVQDSGPSRSLVLSRENFPFSASSRFIPAHKPGHSAQNLSIPPLIASPRRSPSSQNYGIGRPNYRRRVLRLPDLDHCKLAVLNSLGSPASRRVYEYAIDQFIAWYCSEPRLAFNRIVVVRYRMYLESRHLAANTINQQLAGPGASRGDSASKEDGQPMACLCHSSNHTDATRTASFPSS
jgi:hypothetical protein